MQSSLKPLELLFANKSMVSFSKNISDTNAIISSKIFLISSMLTLNVGGGVPFLNKVGLSQESVSTSTRMTPNSQVTGNKQTIVNAANSVCILEEIWSYGQCN